MPDEDLELLLQRLKGCHAEDQRTVPQSVRTALGVLSVECPGTEDDIAAAYNNAMRFRQVRKSAPTVSTVQYLMDVSIFQDLVTACLIAGIEQVIASRRKAMEPTTEEPPVAIDERQFDDDADGPIDAIFRRRNTLWRSLQAKTIKQEAADLATDYVEDTGFLFQLLREAGSAYREFTDRMSKVYDSGEGI